MDRAASNKLNSMKLKLAAKEAKKMLQEVVDSMEENPNQASDAINVLLTSDQMTRGILKMLIEMSVHYQELSEGGEFEDDDPYMIVALAIAVGYQQRKLRQ